MAGGRNQDSVGDTAPYLPERYSRRLYEKQRRRLIRKILVVGIVITVTAIFILGILGIFSDVQHSGLTNISPSQMFPQISNPAPKTEIVHPIAPDNLTGNVTIPATQSIALGSGLQIQAEPDQLPLEKAIDLIRIEFPAPAYSIASVNLTVQDGRKLYEFTILPGNGNPIAEGKLIFIDTISGDPYTPGQELAKITAEQAKRIAGNAFPTLKPDLIRVRYTNQITTSPAWNFILITGNATIASGSLDADTGRISSFSRQVFPGRPAESSISRSDAQAISDKTITSWNGVLPISLVSGHYGFQENTETPVGGRYVFDYSRIVQDMPCDSDGFTLAIDSVSGDILDYERRWNDPDNAFSVASDPLVTKREATFAILRKAKEIAPESINSIQILSTRLLWKDRHAPGITPRPGSIPLAWKVEFNDDVIRAGQPGALATGWVDAQTGAVLEMDYRY